jgi:hypothetical protein
MIVWDISTRLGAEYVPMVNDLMRVACMQVTVQLLLSMVDGDNNPFFSGVFWLVLLYLLLGVATYHLAFVRLVAVK